MNEPRLPSSGSDPAPPPGPGFPWQTPPPGDRDPGPARPPVAVQMAAARPLITYAILILTVGVFLLQLASEQWFGRDLPLLFGAKITSAIQAGEWWRLITPVLLHGSLLHIGFNMYALYVMGPSLERFYGHGRFLALYVIGGLAGNVASFWLTQGAAVGASSSLYGLFAAQGIFAYLNRTWMGPRAQAMLRGVGQLVIINLVISLTPGIDLWGHVGGLIGGGLFAWFSGPRLHVEGLYPMFTLEESRPAGESWLAAGVLALGLIGLAAIRMF